MIHIRSAAVQDAPALLRIYAPYVTDTTITFEYAVPTTAEFARRTQTTLQSYPYLVAEENGQPLGYAYASPFKSRAAYAWAVETSIYVQQGCHGKGVGTLLYTALEDALQRQHVHSINACITWPNEESIRFHEKCGYTLCAHFHKIGYKFGRWLDVVWMEKHLSIADPPLPFLPYPDLR